MKVSKATRLKLYPAKTQEYRLTQHAGACRWLWNHLLDLQKKTHAETGKFVFFHDLSKMLPGLKKDYPWLAEAPSNSLVRVCKNLDGAMRKCFREDAGFPRFKARGKSKESFYVINQAMRIEDDKVVLPKLGPVRFRTGRRPEGRIVGANVSFDGRAWWCAVQYEVEIDILEIAPTPETVLGVDLGIKELMVSSDGQRIAAPKHLRKAERRLRRAQRRLLKRVKRSANRKKQAKIVAALHRKVRDKRRDMQHKATAELISRATAIVTEDPNVSGMMKNRHLAKSFTDAGWGEVLRQIAYKTAWAGKTHIKIDRFEPSTQTCSCCGFRRTGADKLTLSQRTYRCASCGLEMDRDLNAAMNLRRIGLEMLTIGQPIIIHQNNVGQVLPERAGDVLADACGETSTGPEAFVSGRHVSLKQEVLLQATSYET